MQVVAAKAPRLPMLDGWRALSILLVLAGHLLPLGLKSIDFNATVAATGMALFFTLSGFLITDFLLRAPPVSVFLVRRLCRILPLAWLYLVIVLPLAPLKPGALPAHLLFYGNLPPYPLSAYTSHFWSLCVEMQFYAAVALLYGLAGTRGLLLLPLAGLAVTALRVSAGAHASIVTWLRIDEILAGATLALAWHHHAARFAWRQRHFATPLLLLATVAASCEAAGALDYARPWLAALTVASTLAGGQRLSDRVLASRPMRYIAEISYALYVIHGGLRVGWLGTGASKFAMYLKRPLLFAVLWALAHLSTFHYEHRFIALGRRFGRPRAFTDL